MGIVAMIMAMSVAAQQMAAPPIVTASASEVAREIEIEIVIVTVTVIGLVLVSQQHDHQGHQRTHGTNAGKAAEYYLAFLVRHHSLRCLVPRSACQLHLPVQAALPSGPSRSPSRSPSPFCVRSTCHELCGMCTSSDTGTYPTAASDMPHRHCDLRGSGLITPAHRVSR